MEGDIQSAPVGVFDMEAALSDDTHHGGGDAPSRNEATLRRIAQMLGIPERAFLTGAATDDEIADTAEMLRIWGALGHGVDRRKILSFARAIAAARQ